MKKLFEFYDKITFPKILVIFFIISIVISSLTYMYIGHYSKTYEDNYNLIETKITKMIKGKKFDLEGDIAISQCDLSLISDTLTISANYKNAIIKVTVINYSSNNPEINIERLTNDNLELTPSITVCFLVGLIISLAIFVVICLTIKLWHYIYSHIFRGK